jgi:hypothetical protein
MEISSQGWRFLRIFTSCPRAAAVIALLACQVAEIPAILPRNAVSKISVEKCKFPKKIRKMD